MDLTARSDIVAPARRDGYEESKPDVRPPGSLESQPVIHLHEKDVRRGPPKQRPGVVAKVDLAARQTRRSTPRPHHKERRSGIILPAQHRVAAQRTEREAGIVDQKLWRRSGRTIGVDPVLLR